MVIYVFAWLVFCLAFTLICACKSGKLEEKRRILFGGSIFVSNQRFGLRLEMILAAIHIGPIKVMIIDDMGWSLGDTSEVKQVA